MNSAQSIPTISRSKWRAEHKTHLPVFTPRGPYLNPEQPRDHKAPRLLCLQCPCGAVLVYSDDIEDFVST